MHAFQRFSTLRAIAAAASLCAGGPAAWAAPVVLAGTTGSIGATQAVPQGSGSNSASYQGSSAQLQTRFNGNLSSLAAVSASAFAATNGAYGLKADLTNSFARQRLETHAQTSQTYTLSNTGAVDQRYVLTFRLDAGHLRYSSCNSAGSLFCIEPGLGGNSVLQSYGMSVLAGGTALFNTQATLVSSFADIPGSYPTAGAARNVLTKTGFDLNAADDGTDGDYSWNAIDVELDLGLLAAGASLDIAFDAYLDMVSNGAYVSADASFGDPISYAASPNARPNLPVFTQVPLVAAVPEPAGLALAATALAACAPGTRRRRAGATRADRVSA